MSLNDVIVITGPTCSGKSKLAHMLARAIGSEIIVADSMKIYKKADIATAKPSLDLRKVVKYHLIDMVEPDKRYNAGEFVRSSVKIIDALHARNSVPVICGGTSLYIAKLMDGLADIPKPDESIVVRLEAETTEELYRRLQEIDMERAKDLHPNMRKRIVRALAVCMSTGKKMSSFMKDTRPHDYNFIVMKIDWDREKLYERINSRVDRMFDDGLEAESRSLYAEYGADSPVFEGVGYRQMIPYINGEQDLKQAKEEIKKATRNYAKKQLTWWRGNEAVIGLDIEKMHWLFKNP